MSLRRPSRTAGMPPEAEDVDMSNAFDEVLAVASAAAAAEVQQAENEGADTAMQEDEEDEDDDDDTESHPYSEDSLLSSEDERSPLEELRGEHATEEVRHDERTGLAEMPKMKDSTATRHPYPHLREISPLASWHVSSHKQNCGVPALRHPSISQFWQSDGPQPHTLTIHFFKRVAIAHMRLHIDHELDESYTPTKMQIWAGCGMHDLIQVTEVGLDNPKGWLVVDLSRAGGPSDFVEGEEDVGIGAGLAELVQEDPTMMARELAKRKKRAAVGRGPTLRCMVVQVRILENYQNGKDTHLRGCQIFAKDHGAVSRTNAWLRDRQRQHGMENVQSDRYGQDDDEQEAGVDEVTLLRHRLEAEARRAQAMSSEQGAKVLRRSAKTAGRSRRTVAGIREADWMGEVSLR